MTSRCWLLLWVGLWGAAAAPASEAQSLEDLIAQYVEAQRGDEGADPVFLPQARLAQQSERERMLQALREIRPDTLSLQQRTDLDYLLGVIESDLHTDARQQRWRNDPAMYLPARRIGLLTDAGAPEPVALRATQLAGLLDALPEQLALARQQLGRPPQRFTREAIFQARNSRDSLVAAQAAFAETVDAALLAGSLELLDAHIGFLEDELLPRSDGDWRFGREAYEFVLRHRWHMDTDADGILARGRQAFQDTEAQAIEVAARIDAGRHWTEVYESLKDHHPDPAGLKQAYQSEMDRARAFVREHRILTLPHGEHVITVDTPPAMRRSSPFGTFQSVSPFDDGLEGRLVLTPVEDWMTPEQAEQRLRSHHLAWTPVIAVHEAYPGHHAHAIKLRENPRLLRRVAREPIFTEGWGLMTEELMFEMGFLRGDAVRLTQLRNRLWRAARVILDVSLHTGRMEFEEAVGFLVEKVRFDPYAAELEVGMYVRRPTYVLGYLIGMQELLAIREAWIAEHGEPDPPSVFYDRLLRVGSIPPALARRELLGDPEP